MVANRLGTLWFAAAFLATVALSGCGIGPAASVPTETTGSHPPGMTGHVHGGQQPVVASQVYLYAVGTTAGGPAVSLLIAPGFVLTDLNGNFSITGRYTCPANSYVYLLAVGGNPGLPNGVNPDIALAAGLGPCSALSASTFVTINEVTTVAFAYSLAAFATSDTQISVAYPEYSQQPFTNIINMTDPTSGVALASNDMLITQQAKLNTLANALAACVNSSGIGTPCSTLISASGATQANTFQAALTIAQNPTVNLSAIYNVASPAAVFQPSLSMPPTDWTITATDLTQPFNRDANTVFFSTSLGNMCVELRPDLAPKNVADFLSYVNSGAYNNSFIHRSVPGFIIQGGGYTFSNGQVNAIPTGAPVVDEVNLLNLRGTIAMAKSTPNSATDQFFFNTADNFSLQTQSGGFTVIGSAASSAGGGVFSANDVPGSDATCGGTGGSQSLAVMDAINALPVYNFASPFDSLPLINYTPGAAVGSSNFIFTNTPTLYPYSTALTPLPTFLPPPGSYSSPPTITIQDSAPNSTFVCYNFTTASVCPSGPFQLTSSTFLYVSATSPAYSSRSEGEYVYYGVASTTATAAPVITPKGNMFSGSQLVTMSDATPGAIITYSLDGTSPQGPTGQVYTAPFTVTSSVRVFANATASGHTLSPQTQVIYNSGH